MSALSDRRSEERRVIDVKPIAGDSLAAQIEDIHEGDTEDRTIVARIGHFALTDRRHGPAPRTEQFVPTRRDRTKKTGCRGADGGAAGDRRGITEPELRVGGQKLDEPCGVASIDGGKDALPPRTVGPKLILEDDGGVHSVYRPLQCQRVDDLISVIRIAPGTHSEIIGKLLHGNVVREIDGI
jgi:hypothetical protein